MPAFLAVTLLYIVFITSLFGWNVSLAPGLSIKNAVLYAVIGLLMARAVVMAGASHARAHVDATHPGQMRLVHFAFLFLVIYSIATIIPAAMYGGFAVPTHPTWNFSLRNNIISLKSQLVDQLLFFAVFFYAARNIATVRWMLTSFFLLVTFSSLVTVIDVFNIPDLGLIRQKGAGDAEGRIYGPMGHGNEYATFTLTFIPGLIAAALVSFGVKRVTLIVGTLCSFMLILLAGSRGAMAGLLVGAAIAAFFLREHIRLKHLIWWPVAAGFCLVAAVGVVGMFYGDMIQSRFVGQTSEATIEGVTTGRTLLWGYAVEGLREHPWAVLTGHGWNAYIVNYGGRNPHNTYLWYLYDVGLLGLAAYIAILYGILSLTRRAMKCVDDTTRPLFIGFYVGFWGMIVATLVVCLFLPWAFIWAYAGVMCRFALHVIADARDVRVDPSKSTAGGVRQTGEPVPARRVGSAAALRAR